MKSNWTHCRGELEKPPASGTNYVNRAASGSLKKKILDINEPRWAFAGDIKDSSVFTSSSPILPLLFPPKHTMSFHDSSRNIELVNGRILSAQCRKIDGSWVPAALDINNFIWNDDGHFKWGGKDFCKTAKDIQLTGSTVLSARLIRKDGSITSNLKVIDLSDRIANQDGELVYTVSLNYL